MPPLQILLTGATGYVGGSVLTKLTSLANSANRNLQITALVRRSDQAAALGKIGIDATLIDGLDDTARLQQLASRADIVFHCAAGHHTASAKALIDGLGDSMKTHGRQTYYIHTTGTSNLAHIAPSYEGLKLDPISDLDDVYEEEKRKELEISYHQRTTDLAVIENATRTGVKAYLLMPPTIYGEGTGLFNRQSVQIPFAIKTALTLGHPEFIGDGAGGVGYVHIDDLVSLYELIFLHVLDGRNIPSGKHGIYFCNTGEFTWKGVNEKIGEVGTGLGALKSPLPVSVSLDEADQRWNFFADRQVLETNFYARSSTVPELAYGLGWKPNRTEEDWERAIEESWLAVLRQSRPEM